MVARKNKQCRRKMYTVKSVFLIHPTQIRNNMKLVFWNIFCVLCNIYHIHTFSKHWHCATKSQIFVVFTSPNLVCFWIFWIFKVFGCWKSLKFLIIGPVWMKILGIWPIVAHHKWSFRSGISDIHVSIYWYIKERYATYALCGIPRLWSPHVWSGPDDPLNIDLFLRMMH